MHILPPIRGCCLFSVAGSLRLVAPQAGTYLFSADQAESSHTGDGESGENDGEDDCNRGLRWYCGRSIGEMLSKDEKQTNSPCFFRLGEINGAAYTWRTEGVVGDAEERKDRFEN